MPIFLTDYLHLPIRLYGLLFTINTLIIVFTEIPLNLATLNWSAKRSAQIGCLFIGLGFTGFCFATTISHIILLTILWTIGEMILFPAASAYVAEIAPQHIRGTYMSLYSVSFNVGLCLGPWLGGLTLGHYEPTVLWSMCGVLTILSITLLSFMPKTTNISAIHQPSTSHVPTA